jgi:hypothetical protein
MRGMATRAMLVLIALVCGCARGSVLEDFAASSASGVPLWQTVANASAVIISRETVVENRDGSVVRSSSMQLHRHRRQLSTPRRRAQTECRTSALPHY